MYQKLVDVILKALEGQNFGNNKIVVETTSSGIVEVSSFEEIEEELKEKSEEIEQLYDSISELEQLLSD